MRRTEAGGYGVRDDKTPKRRFCERKYAPTMQIRPISEHDCNARRFKPADH